MRFSAESMKKLSEKCKTKKNKTELKELNKKANYWIKDIEERITEAARKGRKEMFYAPSDFTKTFSKFEVKKIVDHFESKGFIIYDHSVKDTVFRPNRAYNIKWL